MFEQTLVKLNPKFRDCEWSDSDRIEAVSVILDDLLDFSREEYHDMCDLEIRMKIELELDRCLSILASNPGFLKRNSEKILNG